jgi:hypothetical protein
MDSREAAVEHLSTLLEDDRVELDVYRRLVARVLSATNDEEIRSLLELVPEEPPLMLRCHEGVVRETPLRVPAMTVLTCDSGVMKVDLSDARFARDVDLDVECDSGVLTVVLPRDVRIEIAEREGEGSVLVNRARAAGATLDSPRVHVYVHNGGGVVTLRHRRRGLSFRPGRGGRP